MHTTSHRPRIGFLDDVAGVRHRMGGPCLEGHEHVLRRQFCNVCLPWENLALVDEVVYQRDGDQAAFTCCRTAAKVDKEHPLSIADAGTCGPGQPVPVFMAEEDARATAFASFGCFVRLAFTACPPASPDFRLRF